MFVAAVKKTIYGGLDDEIIGRKKQHYGGRGKRSVKYVGIHGTPGHHSIA